MLEQRTKDCIVMGDQSGIISVNSQGVLLAVNSIARMWLELSEEQKKITGKKVSEVAEIAPLEPIFQKILKEKQEIISQELSFSINNQEQHLFSITATQLQDENDKVSGAVVAFEDITRKRQIEQKMQEGKCLVCLGNIVGGVLHEIKNPLAAIRGFTELLGRMVPKDPKAQEYKQIIFSEVDRLNTFALNFLKYTRTEQNAPIFTNVNMLAIETVSLCQELLKKNRVRPVFELQHEIPQSHMESNHAKQVLLNLIQNAAQAMEETGGGILRIQTRLEKANEEEKNLFMKRYGEEIKSDGDLFVKIHVIDDGPGLSEEARAHLFEPFFTTKAGGTGVGLNMSRKLMEMQKGLLELTPNNGEKGAHFIMVLPFRKAREEEEKKAA